MKILVTGGAGYIGSHTILEIIRLTDWDVISADNFLRSSPKTFERIKSITGKTILNYPGNLTDLSATEKIFKENPDISGVIHFAALKSVPESVENPDLYHHNNMRSLENILACLVKFKIAYFIFSSSCSVYGNIASLPVNEDTPCQKAESPYALTKQLGEDLIRQFTKSHSSLHCIALRYFNPVGAHFSGKIGEVPWGKPQNVVPSITQTAVGLQPQLLIFGNDYNTRDGSCIRDYIHVSDIARAHVLALQELLNGHIKTQFEIINLGSGKGVSVIELVNAFESITKIKLNKSFAPRRPGDVEAIYSDSSKAKELLNWSPELGIDQMMKSAWLWEKELGSSA